MTLQIKHLDLGAGLVLMVTVILGVFFIYQAYESGQKDIQLKRHLLSKQTTDLTIAENNLTLLQGVLADSQAILTRLNQRIPRTAGVGDLLTVIHEQINQRNIVLTQFSHKPPEKISRYQRIPLHLILEGKFLALYHLVHDVETLNRLVIIESIRITTSEKQGVCRMELMANVFQEGL